ncbi:hypothetical protein [Streptomyces sp. NPDC059402]|uniref:hypothetical protein n=1 Tax=Streptomyces sp. NPDC059402 TaxID=3346822 RepID=UPI003674C9DB
MNAGGVPALVVLVAGLGALVWGFSLALSCFREYRRSRTVSVEILGEIALDAGPSYRFRVVGAERRSTDGTDWIASTPAGFDGRVFRPGEMVDLDYDPEYPGFVYPPGRYPVCRLWPVVAVVGVVGVALVALGVGLLV